MEKRTWVSLLCTLSLVISAFALSQLAGCGGSSSSGAPTGTLQARITDAPPVQGSYSSVHITVTKVVAVPAGRESAASDDSSLPVIATFPSGTGIEVLSLHFVPQILGQAVLPAGSYTQIRLVLAANTGNVNNNYVILHGSSAQQPLITPSGQESGLKIPGNFTVTAGTINTILLDFNPSTAIVVTGNNKYLLKPTGIRVSQILNSLTNAGTITGLIRSPSFSSWSSATVTVTPRNPAASAVTSGTVFSNFTSTSPGLWSAPFTAFVPPNGSALVPSANYRVFVQAYTHTTPQGPVFSLYSSPLITVTSGADTPVPPSGTVLLTP